MITATGCGDADGQNHAVSFNPGFANTYESARAGYDLQPIPSRLVQQTLTADYTITQQDAAAASQPNAQPSLFYVQCSDDTSEAHFRITK